MKSGRPIILSVMIILGLGVSSAPLHASPDPAFAPAPLPNLPSTINELAQVAGRRPLNRAHAAQDALSLRLEPEATYALGALIESSDEDIAAAAAKAGRRIWQPSSALLEMLESPSVGVRRLATAGLGATASGAAVGPLTIRLGDEDALVRREAIRALGNLGDETPYKRLLVIVNRDPDPTCRTLAREALEALTSTAPRAESSEAYVEKLVSLVPSERSNAATQLRRLKDPRTVGPLMRALRVEPNPDARVAMLEALGDLGDGVALPAVLPVVERGTGQEQSTAIAAVANFRAREALPALMRVLRAGSEPLPRVYAARALSWIGGGGALHSLRSGLRDSDPAVRVECLMGLQRMGDRTAVPQIILLLGDDSTEVRAASAQLLGVWERADATVALAKRLDDPSAEVRQAAIVALGVAGDRRAAAPLTRFIQSEQKREVGQQDTYLIKEADKSLRKIAARDAEKGGRDATTDK